MAAITGKVFTKKRVVVLYYGGGFGMKKTINKVLEPVASSLLEFLKRQKEMHDPEVAQKYFTTLQINQLVLPVVDNTVLLYEIIESSQLQDSSNMKPSDWSRIATDIGRHYDNFDGIVIIQGTDTMAYTASALSFMLEGLEKTIVLTGGLVPIYKLRNDSKDNLLLSLIIAGCYIVPEVCILFSSKLYRGNRAVNSSSASLDCFTSFNYHALADIGFTINVHNEYVRKPDNIPFNVITINTNPHIVVIKFTPTLMPSTLEAVVRLPVDAIILQTFGTGTMRNNKDEYFKILKWGIERGMIIVNITQCLHGSVSLTYEAGQWLADIGVANGRDMTCEATIAKLYYILPQNNLSRKQKIELIETDLRGEMTK